MSSLEEHGWVFALNRTEDRRQVFRWAPPPPSMRFELPSCERVKQILVENGYPVVAVYSFYHEVGISTMIVVLNVRQSIGETESIKLPDNLGKLRPLRLSEPGNLILRDADFEIVANNRQPDESYGEHWDKVKPLLETDPKHLDLLYISGLTCSSDSDFD